MIARNETVLSGAQSSVLSTHKVLRNTYMLLSMTLLFSGATAAYAVVTNAPPMHWLVMLVGMFGLLFLTSRLRNSAWGLVSVFAFTGFMGYTLGPILSLYLKLPNGAETVMTAMAATGGIFLALSAYVLTSRKDFSFMGGFLFVGLIVAVLAGLGATLFNIPSLSLGVSAMIVLLMSGYILYDTSAILHGGETNYIMATVSLYLDIFNLFVNLLQLLGVLGGDD
ncbi:Bax inhibitor-1/YccA family protein [Plasticicumulans acidivorans]|uniref:Modulator of FtsH protease n=1 Tax=Plasticicumulans acidivorans TaxID=886464 RepID=A0A317MZX9_9GAMM|nr:Bax inhibitor-1/YccA family protein [Plasticicumulans acidivorans]PWV65862.1 modulator of FtsH protease [Plasticicumulans acidivorans]